MRLDIRVDIDNAIRRLGVVEKQAKYAAMVAINRTLPEMQRAVVAEMARTYDRPTPYTLGGTFVRQATRTKLEGMVALKDERAAGKGVPATKYLAPSVFGGDRNEKRFEKALRAAGILPAGMFATKGDAAKTDAYGNMDRGYAQALREARLARWAKRRGWEEYAITLLIAEYRRQLFARTERMRQGAAR